MRREKVNLRYVNQFLKMDSFKYEDLRTLLAILSPNDFLFKFDLKSGYHHVDTLEVPGLCMGLKPFMYSLSCHLALQLLAMCLPSFCTL